ncbi:MAG: hypothetical protein B6245_04985, partial [Desulfobacteraceae bacterium 4572_88]
MEPPCPCYKTASPFFKGGLRGISPAASLKIPPGPPLRKGGEKCSHTSASPFFKGGLRGIFRLRHLKSPPAPLYERGEK